MISQNNFDNTNKSYENIFSVRIESWMRSKYVYQTAQVQNTNLFCKLNKFSYEKYRDAIINNAAEYELAISID